MTSTRTERHQGGLGPETELGQQIATGTAVATPDPSSRGGRTTHLRVKGLNVHYGDFHAVADINMDIAPNAVTALIGSSGCGKSTFLRSLNRMHELIPGARTEGLVELDGQDIYAPDVDPVLVRRKIGMVFQSPNPFPTMSIYDNVAAGIKLNGSRVSRSELDGVVVGVHHERVAPVVDAVLDVLASLDDHDGIIGRSVGFSDFQAFGG